MADETLVVATPPVPSGTKARFNDARLTVEYVVIDTNGARVGTDLFHVDVSSLTGTLRDNVILRTTQLARAMNVIV